MFGRRLKRERGARMPVTVITGFLGAGKTTLLKRFLATPEGQGTAVVVNEFGADRHRRRAGAIESPTRPCCSAMAACAASRAPTCSRRCAAW